MQALSPGGRYVRYCRNRPGGFEFTSPSGTLQMAYALSHHAHIRVRQRGVPRRIVDALIAFADFEAPVGGGCTVLRLSRDRLGDHDLAAELGSERDRLSRLSLIWSEAAAEVVTVLRHHPGKRGRRYRRGR